MSLVFRLNTLNVTPLVSPSYGSCGTETNTKYNQLTNLKYVYLNQEAIKNRKQAKQNCDDSLASSK